MNWITLKLKNVRPGKITFLEKLPSWKKIKQENIQAWKASGESRPILLKLMHLALRRNKGLNYFKAGNKPKRNQ